MTIHPSRVLWVVFALLTICNSVRASEAKSPVPYKMEFLDRKECGEDGYVVSTRPLGPFSVLVSVEVCTIRFVQHPVESFVVPVVKGAGFHSRPGVPNVPVVRFYFAGPAGFAAAVSDLFVDSTTIPGMVVGPLQADHDEGEAPLDEWIVDVDAYSRDFPAQTVAMARSSLHRGQVQMNLFEVALARYSGPTGELQINSGIQFMVTARGGHIDARAWNYNISGDWGRFYRDLVVNHEDMRFMPVVDADARISSRTVSGIVKDNPGLPDGPGGPDEPPDLNPDGLPDYCLPNPEYDEDGCPCPAYLVVVQDNLKNAFNNSELRDRIGSDNPLAFAVLSMDEIKNDVNGDYSPRDIRRWIQMCHNNEPSRYPDYLLLVGDTPSRNKDTWVVTYDENHVPSFFNRKVKSTPMTDQFYCSDLEREENEPLADCTTDDDCLDDEHYCHFPTSAEAATKTNGKCRLIHEPGLPEIFCGRLPVSTVEELNILSGKENGNYDYDEGTKKRPGKLLAYHPEQQGSCIGNRNMCSAFGKTSFAADAHRNNLYVSGYGGMVIDEIGKTVNKVMTDLQSCMESMPGILTYRGHGEGTGLSGLGFDVGFFMNSDADQDYGWLSYPPNPNDNTITSEPFMPPMFSVACDTGSFMCTFMNNNDTTGDPSDDFLDQEPCLSEEMLLHPSRGVSMFMGASVPSPHFRNITFYDELMDRMFRFDDSLSGYSMGQILVLSKARVIQVWGLPEIDDLWYSGTTSRLLDEYNLLGEAKARYSVKNCDLVGFWRFDDSDGPWLDHSAYGRDATDSNTEFVDNRRTGGRGCKMGGTLPSCWSELSDFEYDFKSEFTYSTWFTLNSPNVDGYLAKFAIGEEEPLFFILRDENSLSTQMTVYPEVGDSCSISSSIDALGTDVWKMLTLVYFPESESSYVDLYLDGQLVKSVSSDCTGMFKSMGTGTFKLGYALNGAIDEVRLYDKALSQDEISRIYEFDAAFLKDGPAMELTFDTEYGDAPGDTGVDFMDSGPMLGGVNPTMGSRIVLTEGISGDSVFLEPGDSFVSVAEQFAAGSEDGFGLTFWLRPRLVHDGDEHGSIARLPGVFDIYIDYATHKLCLTDGAHCCGGLEGEFTSDELDYDAWHAYAVSVDFNDDTVTWWVDGIYSCEMGLPDAMTTAEIDDLLFGEGYAGRIDQIKVYSGPLRFIDVAGDAFRQGMNVLFSFDSDTIRSPLSGGTLLDLSGFWNLGTTTNIDICDFDLQSACDPSEDEPLVKGSARFQSTGDTDYESVEFSDSTDSSVDEFTVSVWVKIDASLETDDKKSAIWAKGGCHTPSLSLEYDGISDEIVVKSAGNETHFEAPPTDTWTLMVLTGKKSGGSWKMDFYYKTVGSSPETQDKDNVTCTGFTWYSSLWNLGCAVPPESPGGCSCEPGETTCPCGCDGQETCLHPFVGMMDEFAIYYKAVSDEYIAGALYKHAANNSWASGEYPLSANVDGLVLDVTPYGNHGLMVAGIDNHFVQQGAWDKDAEYKDCPVVGQCLDFNGKDQWIKVDPGWGWDETSDEAFVNAHGDLTTCFWQKANPDSHSNPNSGQQTSSLVTSGNQKAGLRQTVSRESPSAFRSEERLWWNGTVKGTGNAESAQALKGAPDFSFWRRICVETSKLTGDIRYFIDGTLAGVGSFFDFNDIDSDDLIQIASDASGEYAFYKGQLGSVQFLSRPQGQGRQFLEAGRKQLRSLWTFDGHLHDSWPSKRELSLDNGDAPAFTAGRIGMSIYLDDESYMHSAIPVPLDQPVHSELSLGGSFNAEVQDTAQTLLALTRDGQSDPVVVSLTDSNGLNVSVFGVDNLFSVDWETGEWHSFAARVGPAESSPDECELTFYFDGTKHSSSPVQLQSSDCDNLSGTDIYAGSGESGTVNFFTGSLDEVFISSVPLDESVLKYMHHRIAGIWHMNIPAGNALDAFHVPFDCGTEGIHGYVATDSVGWTTDDFGCPNSSPVNDAGSSCLRVGYFNTQTDGISTRRTDFAFTRSGIIDDLFRGFTYAAWVHLEDAEEMGVNAHLLAIGRQEVTSDRVGLRLAAAHDGSRLILNGTSHFVPFVFKRNHWVHAVVVVDPWSHVLTLHVKPDGGTAKEFTVPMDTGPVVPAADIGTGTACNYSSLHGYLDEVYVINRVLSDDEIEQVRQGTWEDTVCQ
jgi:hypothetical protein